MIAATARSGHIVFVPNTPSEAAITAMLPIASLREQIHTEGAVSLMRTRLHTMELGHRVQTLSS